MLAFYFSKVCVLCLGVVIILLLSESNFQDGGLVSTIFVVFCVTIHSALVNTLFKQKNISPIISFINKKIFLLIVVFLLTIFLFLTIAFVLPILSPRPDFLIYIIDNSGSMGCKEEGTPISNGECGVYRTYKVDKAKDLVKNDIQWKNLEGVTVDIYEIGGKTSSPGDCRKEFISMPAIKIKTKSALHDHLDKIKPNDSGATDLGGALLEVGKRVISEIEATEIKNPSVEIKIYTDSEFSCAKGLPFEDAIIQLGDQGFNATKEDFLKGISVFGIGMTRAQGQLFHQLGLVFREIPRYKLGYSPALILNMVLSLVITVIFGFLIR